MPFAVLDDSSGGFLSWYEGRRAAADRNAVAPHDVTPAEAGVLDLHERLPGAGFRDWQVDDAEISAGP